VGAYINFLTNLFAWPGKYAFFRNSAEWLNTHLHLRVTPWDAMILWICLTILVVHGAFLVYFWLTRRGMKNSEVATGRFATLQEIRKYYQLPGPPSFYANRIVITIAIPVLFLLLVNAFDLLGVVLVTFPTLLGIGLVMYFTPFLNYQDYAIKLNLKPFPLGRWKGKRVGVLGGVFKNALNMRIREKQRQEHVLIVGPTGLGKTTTFFIPGLIEDAYSNDSCFVIDIKDNGDIVDIVGPEWIKAGKKVISFNPWKKEESIHFNPLLNLKPDLEDPITYYTIQTIVDSIYRVNEELVGKSSAEGSYYLGPEMRFLEGLMFAALFHPEEKRTIVAVAEEIAGTVESVTNFILAAIRVSEDIKTESVKQLYKEVGWFIDKPSSSSDRENPMDYNGKRNMLNGIYKKVKVFLDPYVKRHFIRDELDLDIIFKEPCLFSIKAPQSKNPKGIILASIITRLVMLKVLETGEERTRRGHNVWMYLDEFASLKLPDITNFVATVRSSGGGVVAAIQDLEDLFTSTHATATGNSPQSLESNFGTTVILGGCSPETCKRASASFGDKLVLEKSKIQDVFAFFTFRSMKRWSKVPLVTQDSLQRMGDGRAMVTPNRRRPFWIEVTPYFRDKRYKKYVIDRKPPFHLRVISYCYEKWGTTDTTVPDKKPTFLVKTINHLNEKWHKQYLKDNPLLVLWKPEKAKEGDVVGKPVSEKTKLDLARVKALSGPTYYSTQNKKPIFPDSEESGNPKENLNEFGKGRDIATDYFSQDDDHHHPESPF
jgi:type IV secretion system protein VirD4